MSRQVSLEDQEWQQLVTILSDVAMPWRVTNPLLTKIVQQIQMQQQQPPTPRTNSGDELDQFRHAETRHGSA